MTDAEAREYAIAALDGFARELTGAIEHQREINLVDFIDRMHTAAGRIDTERREEDRVAVLEEAYRELDQRVEFLAGRVLGGLPRAGLVVEDVRLVVRENVDRRRRGLDSRPLSNSTVID